MKKLVIKKIPSLYGSIKKYVLEFLKIQLFLTLISLPFLLMWGLPFSLMTVVGNFIFTPVLGLFLLLSSLLFFTELLYIPNGFLIPPFELLQKSWQFILASGRKEWMIGFTTPHILVLITIPAIALGILYTKKYIPLSRVVLRIGIAVTIIFISLWGYTFVVANTRQKVASTLPDTLQIFRTKNNKLIFIDKGFLNTRPNAFNTVTYELKPYLLKTYGTTHFGKVIMYHPKARSFCAIAELSKSCAIDVVELPFFDEELNKYDWKCFFDLKRTLADTGVPLARCKGKSSSLRSPKTNTRKSVTLPLSEES